jgi:hypothetical protein
VETPVFHRPAAWLRAASPRALGLPGLVTAELSWEEQAYAVAAGEAVETRRRASLSLSDWVSSRLRYQIGVAGDRWSDRGTAASLGLGLEARLAGDRLALRLAAEGVSGSAGHPGFGSWRAALRARTSAAPQRLVATLDASLQGASAEAPRGLWPGAGTGHARPLLLRAHPLLEDGVIRGPAFGTGLLHASAELELRLARLGPLRLAAAAFVDHARAQAGPGAGWGEALTGAGGGLRLHLPGERVLRVDAATPLDAGGLTFSAGWLWSWPR